MLAVGEHEFGEVDGWTLRMTTAFAGGIGGSKVELCGALSAGIMIIGALHGRSQPGVDDRACQALADQYRSRFAETLGATCCQELRARYPSSCSWLVEQAATILLDTLDRP